MDIMMLVLCYSNEDRGQCHVSVAQNKEMTLYANVVSLKRQYESCLCLEVHNLALLVPLKEQKRVMKPVSVVCTNQANCRDYRLKTFN
jgi:hypothetical protein